MGREDQIRALNDFAVDPAQRVCILSGRGGIGKSKILYDWANSKPTEVVFLKDEPLWLGGSEKEIPVNCTTVIVDDAHRQQDFGKVLQLLQDTAANRKRSSERLIPVRSRNCPNCRNLTGTKAGLSPSRYWAMNFATIQSTLPSSGVTVRW